MNVDGHGRFIAVYRQLCVDSVVCFPVQGFFRGTFGIVAGAGTFQNVRKLWLIHLFSLAVPVFFISYPKTRTCPKILRSPIQTSCVIS